MHDETLSKIRAMRPCHEAIVWVSTQSNAVSAWDTCERPDWMIWFAIRRNVDRKTLVRIACDCARTALRFVPEGEDRPRIAIETAERWTRDEATIEEVRNAAYAASAAADAAADAAAYYAAYYAAYAAAYFAAYAAADAAAYFAAYAAADVRLQANIQMCAIIRRHIRYEDIAI